MDEHCRRFQESYGNTDVPDELAEHAITCDTCHRFVQRQQTLHSFMFKCKTPGFSPDFSLNVMARLAEESNTPKSPFALLKELFGYRLSIPVPVGALAIILLLASLMVNFYFWSTNSLPFSTTSNMMASSMLEKNTIPENFQNAYIPTPINNSIVQTSMGNFRLSNEWMGSGAFLLIPIIPPGNTTINQGNSFPNNDDI